MSDAPPADEITRDDHRVKLLTVGEPDLDHRDAEVLGGVDPLGGGFVDDAQRDDAASPSYLHRDELDGDIVTCRDGPERKHALKW